MQHTFGEQTKPVQKVKQISLTILESILLLKQTKQCYMTSPKTHQTLMSNSDVFISIKLTAF